MKEITRKWLDFAEKDLRYAKILFKSKAYEGTIFHCHQAIEKILKAIIVEKKIKLRKTHDLIGLVEDTKIKLSDDILKFIENLNPYYQPIRYPDAVLETKLIYSRLECQKILKLTTEVVKWLKRLIP